MPVRRIQFFLVGAMMVLMAVVLPRIGPARVTQAAAVSSPPPARQQVTSVPVVEAGAEAAVQPVQVLVQPAAAAGLPSLEEFSARVANGDESAYVGVYVSGLLAMRIVPQPAGDFNFIDAAEDAATRYGIAAEAGAVGLLAHNYSGGALFSSLADGQAVYLIDGAGQAHPYQVERIQRYQAVSPTDPFSDFVDLQSGEQLTSSDVFGRNFLSGKLVFQTCIEQGGEWSWGRLFVIAAPLE